MTSTATPSEHAEADRPSPDTGTAGADGTAAPTDPSAPATPAAAPAAVSGAREQLRWLAMFWVMGMAFHFTDGDADGLWLVLLFGIPVLIYPTSVWLFTTFVAVTTGQAIWKLPGIANHVALSIFVGLAFGGAALWLMVRSGFRVGPDGGRGFTECSGEFAERWLATVRTPVTATLLVVYFFTTFHKLNTAFFSADSCAGHLLHQTLQKSNLPDFPFPSFVPITAAIGTVIVESALLILLAVPRTRRWGLLLGVGFHCILAPASFYDFAAVVFALYLLFVPSGYFAQVQPRFAGLRRNALIFFTIHMWLGISAAVFGTTGVSWGLRWHTLLVITWYLTLLPLMITLLRAAFGDRVRWPGWRRGPAVLLVLPLLAFVNGATPYLGLKTTSNYSMFSNLHVEGGHTNHLVPGVLALQFAPFTRDLVTVESISQPDVDIRQPQWLAEKAPYVLPWLELRRLTGLWRDAGATGKDAVRVVYQRDGVTRDVPDAVADPVLGAPLPFWERGLLAFRTLDSGSGPDICRW